MKFKNWLQLREAKAKLGDNQDHPLWGARRQSHMINQQKQFGKKMGTVPLNP